ncbi:MAG TPA: bifunctional glutamate N-acetyltransferase/amino-acid acetyltransferase ArgJ [Beutenbergiaceae bacterium]|nr:bifunctional glutamate N-acetyltransferase/amino-acid acetyltransferase ArgJ [Beutenbergiaceae bacterium]
MSVTAAAGFRAIGVAAGLKDSGKPDLALVVSDGPDSTGAAVFTSNRVVGAPVKLSRAHIRDGTARAVVLNSGGANVCTGERGLADAAATAERAARVLDLDPQDVLVASTGLIGEYLPMERLLTGIDDAAPRLGSTEEAAERAAEAIMTTDTVSKQARARGEGYTVGGMAKGAGMLAPGMATMLAVITTDAAVSPEMAQAALTEAVRTTFNRVDSDGCMSTSDTVVLLASGAADARPSAQEFTQTLHSVCANLARALVADAEGASHDIRLTVTGAHTEAAAEVVARTVSRSNLFKTAIFGNDPNWGRILAEVGTVPEEVAAFDPDDLDVTINGIMVCRGGGAHEPRERVDLAAHREVQILIDLGAGAAEATIWTNDLTHDYIHENSAYST